jgi:hypothetical protein
MRWHYLISALIRKQCSRTKKELSLYEASVLSLSLLHLLLAIHMPCLSPFIVPLIFSCCLYELAVARPLPAPMNSHREKRQPGTARPRSQLSKEVRRKQRQDVEKHLHGPGGVYSSSLPQAQYEPYTDQPFVYPTPPESNVMYNEYGYPFQTYSGEIQAGEYHAKNPFKSNYTEHDRNLSHFSSSSSVGHLMLPNEPQFDGSNEAWRFNQFAPNITYHDGNAADHGSGSGISSNHDDDQVAPFDQNFDYLSLLDYSELDSFPQDRVQDKGLGNVQSVSTSSTSGPFSASAEKRQQPAPLNEGSTFWSELEKLHLTYNILRKIEGLATDFSPKEIAQKCALYMNPNILGQLESGNRKTIIKAKNSLHLNRRESFVSWLNDEEISEEDKTLAVQRMACALQFDDRYIKTNMPLATKEQIQEINAAGDDVEAVKDLAFKFFRLGAKKRGKKKIT